MKRRHRARRAPDVACQTGDARLVRRRQRIEPTPLPQKIERGFARQTVQPPAHRFVFRQPSQLRGHTGENFFQQARRLIAVTDDAIEKLVQGRTVAIEQLTERLPSARANFDN